MKSLYTAVLSFCFLFISDLIISQEKPLRMINDIKYFNDQWHQETQNSVNGYTHPRGSDSFIPPEGFITETFTSNNTIPIPETVVTITDSVFVSGMDNWLFNISLQTFITHSYCSDIDMTLRSPSGKTATITTDNGLDKADVFNGTIWNDKSNPGGQIPYSSNQGLVTDHLFTDNITASALVPEENFSLFIGENPNGWWVLTVHDDQESDGGSLNGWSVEITTIPSEPVMSTELFVNNTPMVIPDIVSVDSVILNVSGLDNYLVDVDLTTWLKHTYSADLDITLKSPSGTIVTLTTDNGSGNDNVFNGTLWDDQADSGGQIPYTNNDRLVTDREYYDLVTATPLVPEESFAAFVGEDPNGTWVLTISDDTGGDGGILDSVYIHLTATGNILPVELVSFSYNVLNNGVNLTWMTSSELNNSGFEVQRFSENKWNVLSFVKGKGTTTESNLYSFNDENLLSGKYLYRLKQINFNGTFEYSKTIEVDYQEILSYNLYQNYPNPFNPSTKISFSIPESGIVKLTVHNIIGETILTLLNQKMDKGIHTFEFEASKLNMNKNGLPSGIYLFRIEINNFTATKKMILLK